ncbi:MAG: hypothetical protein M0Z41_16725, partial [Peptococcaceae bacterium]|nr:hypothetical protein [Peptococcaceae bacterium]
KKVGKATPLETQNVKDEDDQPYQNILPKGMGRSGQPLLSQRQRLVRRQLWAIHLVQNLPLKQPFAKGSALPQRSYCPHHTTYSVVLQEPFILPSSYPRTCLPRY